MKLEYELSVASKRDNMHKSENFIKSFLTPLDLSERRFNFISLAITEAYANAHLHGNKENEEKKVTIVAKIINNELRVTVSDEGEGFNYNIIPDPTSHENLMKENEGGRGLYLMKLLSDELIFENNGAKVTLLFKVKKNTEKKSYL